MAKKQQMTTAQISRTNMAFVMGLQNERIEFEHLRSFNAILTALVLKHEARAYKQYLKGLEEV